MNSTNTRTLEESAVNVVRIHADVSKEEDHYLCVSVELTHDYAPTVEVRTVGTRQGTGALVLPSIEAARDLIAALQSVCDRAEPLAAAGMGAAIRAGMDSREATELASLAMRYGR